MAKKADATTVAADMAPANYRGAVQIIRHSIVKEKEKIQGINSRIGDQWAKVEGYKVNRKAGQIFAALDKLEHTERVDIMRSIDGLIDAAGWDQEVEDLVDGMEGTVVHMRFGKDREDAELPENPGENAAGQDPEIAAVADAIAEKATDRKKDLRAKAGLAGIEAARSHLGTAPQTEPYTGDNSDLADQPE